MQVKLQRAILANKEIPFVFLDAVQLVLSWEDSWRDGIWNRVFFPLLQAGDGEPLGRLSRQA